MTTEVKMFDKALPCFVELFGHSQIAGMVSEQALGGTSFVRVDVPEVDGEQGSTKLYGAAAIYSITPIDEATMLRAVKSLRTRPLEPWSLVLPEYATPSLNSGYLDGSDDESESEF